MNDTKHIDGLKELSRRLSELGEQAGGKVLRNATSSAMLPVMQAAKQSVPVGNKAHKTYKGRLVAPGFAKRSLARRSRLSRDKRTAWAMIGVKQEAFYVVQFLELGTSRIPRRPWLTRAYDQTRDEVTQRLKDRLRIGIDKARKK